MAALLAAVALAVTVGHDPSDAGGPARTSAVAERDGLMLRMDMVAGSDRVAVEARVENRGAEAIRLEPDQCGRVTRAEMTRTRFVPEGRTWTGSAQAVKKLVLERQTSIQGPEALAPRRPGDGSSRVPRCTTPHGPVVLAPHAVLRERWELANSHGLDAVGASHAVIQVEVAGRGLRVLRRVSTVLDHPARGAAAGPSDGQLYDRLLADSGLRTLIAAQPAGSWRQATLLPSSDGLRFKAVTARYGRAIVATAKSDGSEVAVTAPAERDRTRVFARRRATLPPGIRAIDEPQGYMPSQDVLAGRLRLPSGRVGVDAYFTGETRPLPQRAQPGSFPVHVTLARSEPRGGDSVALATLVVTDRRTVRWRAQGGVGVDGGTAAFSSAEGAATLAGLMDEDAGDRWLQRYDDYADSLSAHGYLVTNVSIDARTNLVMFSTGLGDGGYPLYVGLDAKGRPTRYVLDFHLLHLDWPGSG